VPSSVVAPLGVDKVLPDPAEMPPGLYPDDPYFIAVGTIEPRKNHGFLLDLWETPGPDKPLLLICGSRGWNNAEVFARLDTLAEDARIKEVSGLSDAALAALIQGAKGMLFPSLAEGYGLPPVEALRLGTRVLCNDLPVLREVLGDHAHFAPVSDTKLWLKTVNDWTISSGAESSDGVFDPPTWADHFEIVLGKG
jgi:glycosyltransferase involved in cell wall biosynthesis